MAQKLSNLANKSKVKFGTIYGKPIVWLVADKNHAGYPSNSVTLVTNQIIKMLCFDAKESTNSNSNRRSYGNNRYIYSNIRQWLNSAAAAGAWYTAQHSADAAPTSGNVSGGYNAYDRQAGFLNAFTADERAALLNTIITVGKSNTDGGGTETCTDKIFLLSCTEVGISGEHTCGSLLAIFGDNANRIATVTAECVANSNYNRNPAANAAWYYWLRDAYIRSAGDVRCVWDNGVLESYYAYSGDFGLRPACNISADFLVSDTTDSDGCYTIVWNAAPSAPIALNVPTSIYGGRSNTISWSSVTDPDGDTVTYVLEVAYDGGDFAEIYSGSATTYNHTVTFGKATVQYRVKAVDSKGAESGYTTSASRTVINNQPPVISGSDGNLGTKTEGFTQTYSVTDPDNDEVTVVEAIDGVLVRSYVVTLGATNTFYVTGNTWLKQTNGAHTMTITAKDSAGNSVTRTYTFTKTVNTLTVSNITPMASASMPTRIILTVNRTLPAEATFKVEVCNNGYDSSPTWEDATSAVTGNLAHVFENTSKTAAQWGVRVRVTVQRNGGEGACYISAIGGNFE